MGSLNGEAKIARLALPKTATLLLCSTVPASYARSVASELQAAGRGDVRFIDSPVSGGVMRAADGTLSIMAGGSEEALEAGRFLLREMSDANKLYLVPGGVGAGSNMKMVHQVLAGIHILGASEVMGLAARLGLDANRTGEELKASEAWTWMHENRLPRMLAEDWNPGASALTIILKDVVCYCGFSLSILLLTSILPGNHHQLCPPSPLPYPPIQHRRTNLPRRVITGLRLERRLRHGASILP